MGGNGSGRRSRYGTKDTMERRQSLDINWLQREGNLEVNRRSSVRWSCDGKETGSITTISYDKSLVLEYRQRSGGGEWREVRNPVALAWTPCHYGGQRPWFICPDCGRRVGKLYSATRCFLCRHCCGLVYKSQREDVQDRLLRRIQRIRGKLGARSGWIFDLLPDKPKGMHNSTWFRLFQTKNQLMRR